MSVGSFGAGPSLKTSGRATGSRRPGCTRGCPASAAWRRSAGAVRPASKPVNAVLGVVDGKPFDLRQRLLRPGFEVLQDDPDLLLRVPNAGGLLGESLHQGFGIDAGADLGIEEGVGGQFQVRLGGGEESIHDLGVLQCDEPPGEMRVEEGDRQEGALAGAEVEEEGFLRSAGRRRRSRSDEAPSGTGHTIAGIEASWPHGRRARPSASGWDRNPGSEASRTPATAPGGSRPCNEAGPAGSARPSSSPGGIAPPFPLSHEVLYLPRLSVRKRLIGVSSTEAGPSGTLAVTTPADHPGRSRP